MGKRSVRPALLLAAWLLPFSVQVVVLVHLLDSGRHADAPSMTQLLVHGHLHGEGVPEHQHPIQVAPAGPDVGPPLLALFIPVADTLTVRPAGPSPSTSGAALRALSSAPPRHLLLDVLLR